MGYFNSKSKTIINADDLAPFLDVNVEKIMEDIHKWISQGSAWIIKSIEGPIISISSNMNHFLAAHILNFQLNSNIKNMVLLIQRIMVMNAFDGVMLDI